MGRINIRNLVPTFVIFTSSQNWVVPAGVYKIKVLAIGGGGGGGGGYSSTYVGGGGGSGALAYAELAVQPGTKFSIVVGAGGSGGTGGSSPTAGGGGGNSQINYNGVYLLCACGGGGGGAATSSANGAGGSGGSIYRFNVPVGSPFMILDDYDTGGNSGLSGSNNSGGGTPALNATFTGTSTGLGQGNSAGYSYGNGGQGGGVNANGAPGVQGVVIIWWGD
jgi:hypothetical protein